MQGKLQIAAVVFFVCFAGSLARVTFAQPQTSAPPTASAPEKIIIDTDIGDDIDDAFALALALHSPELQILGVTSAFGDTQTRAKLVDRFLGELAARIFPLQSEFPRLPKHPSRNAPTRKAAITRGRPTRTPSPSSSTRFAAILARLLW